MWTWYRGFILNQNKSCPPWQTIRHSSWHWRDWTVCQDRKLNMGDIFGKCVASCIRCHMIQVLGNILLVAPCYIVMWTSVFKKIFCFLSSLQFQPSDMCFARLQLDQECGVFQWRSVTQGLLVFCRVWDTLSRLRDCEPCLKVLDQH